MRRPALALALALVAGTACRSGAPSAFRAFEDPTTMTTAPSPAMWTAILETTKGIVAIEVHRDWAPRGADRFFALVSTGFYDHQRLSRVVPGFIAQWGLHPEPGVIAAWKEAYIPDDQRRESNVKGTVAFAFKVPNTRSTQVFVNLVDNVRLDAENFAPFGKVVRGWEVVESWYGGYGEKSGGGIRAGTQAPIEREGAAWLDANYPKLDRIIRARVER